jgi:hypothetical protein
MLSNPGFESLPHRHGIGNFQPSILHLLLSDSLFVIVRVIVEHYFWNFLGREFVAPTIMNWEMINAVSQMLGAIGVIISIVYLAAQIRNQNNESQRQAMNVLTTHWSDLNRTLVENPEMAALWLRALRSFDDLDAKSKLRFGAHLGRFLRFADSLYLNFLDGTLDKRLWRGYERTIADTVAYPGFQTWWATRKHWHTDEFCALIDRHIQTAKPTIYDGYT